MKQQRGNGGSLRKTCTYRLTPTPAEAQALEVVFSSGRTLYHVALEHRKAEGSVWWCQGSVARRKQGSNRRRKAVKLLAKAHLKAHRQWRDFQCETALAAACQYDTVYCEVLQSANLLKNQHLVKSVQDECGPTS